MTEFLKRLDEALNNPVLKAYVPEASIIAKVNSDLRTLKENKKPQIGIYYWVPQSDDSWRLMGFWKEFYGNDIVHFKLWKRYVLPELKGEFHIDIAPLEGKYHGLPRGRVGQNENGRMVVLHGDDAPVPDFVAKINDEFNLSSENTDWMVVDHEKMDPEHQKLVMDAIRK